MTKKQAVIMLLAVVVGVGVSLLMMQKEPEVVHAFHEALEARNGSLDLAQFERAVETVGELDSQMILMDALLNERDIEGEMSEALRKYAGVSVRTFQYRDVAKQVVSRHPEVFVPALIKRVREISRETGEVKMRGKMVWALPNGEVLIDTFSQLYYLVWTMSERRNEMSDSHHAVRLRLRAGNGKDGLFNSQGQSTSSTFGRMDPEIVGMGDNPKPLDKTMNLDAQIRIVVVNRQNIDEILDAMEATAAKYIAMPQPDEKKRDKGSGG